MLSKGCMYVCRLCFKFQGLLMMREEGRRKRKEEECWWDMRGESRLDFMIARQRCILTNPLGSEVKNSGFREGRYGLMA